ncbi:hypothetical protein BDW22DRAFT_765103 [Trametopsis cervina]|nr:hypothetical protein BDW22DRAFT_765103 [Trametopsis cervina]
MARVLQTPYKCRRCRCSIPSRKAPTSNPKTSQMPRFFTVFTLVLILVLSATLPLTARARTCGDACSKGQECDGGCTCNFYNEFCRPEFCVDFYHCS